MDGLNRITERIASDSEQEAEGLLTLAREDAAALRQRFKKTAEDRKHQLLEAARLQADAALQRAVSAAELEARKTLLSVRQALVAEVFEKALNQLTALAPADYEGFLIRLAVNATLTGTEEILLNPADRQNYGPQVLLGANQALAGSGKNAALTLSAETRSIAGGLILKAGPVESNCSLEVLVALARNTLTAEVAGRLFDS